MEAARLLGRARGERRALRKRLKAQAHREISKSSTALLGTVRVSTHPDVDFVVSAIVGVAGLEATYEAVKAGKTRAWPIKNAWSPPAN